MYIFGIWGSNSRSHREVRLFGERNYNSAKCLSVKSLELKDQEHVNALCIDEKVNSRESPCWNPPPMG